MQILVENLDELERGNAVGVYFLFHVYVWHYYQNPKIFISLILTLEIVLAVSNHGLVSPKFCYIKSVTYLM